MSIQATEFKKETATVALEAEQLVAARQQEEGTQPVLPGPGGQDKAQTTTAYPSQDAEKLIKVAQDYFVGKGVNLHFKMLQDSGEVQVEMVDSESNKIIRKFPQDELVKLSDNLRRMGKGFLNKAV